MRILITGVTGFVGSYLAMRLAEHRQATLFGVSRDPSTLLPALQGRVTCLAGDLRSTIFVRDLLVQIKPEQIYHLAGQPFVPQAWSEPWQTFETNVLPQLNLLHCLIELGMAPRFLSVTSSKVYGPTATWPVTETAPLQPDSPYGVSKASQDLLARQYFLSHNLPIIIARPFNHIGPRQNRAFVTASFARQIALAEAGQGEAVVRVGNLTARRDFTHVQDVVRAYTFLMERGHPGEAYNIGSGQAVAIQQILDMLIALSQAEILVETDPERMRPADQLVSYGDISKIEAHTGWRPEISLETSLGEILDYWRGQIQQTTAKGANL